MLKTFVTAVALILTISPGALVPEASSAQSPRQAPAAPQQAKARQNIFVMEGVLERAVEEGANNLRNQVRRLMPDLLLFGGAAEARGVRLEGYGVFFDVAVPALRESVAWSLRMMIDENGIGATTALQQLRAHIESISDRQAKANLQQAIKRLEMQVGGPSRVSTPAAMPVAPAPGTVSAASAEPATVAPAPGSSTVTPEDEALLASPTAAYTRAVKGALIDAMLDYSQALRIGADEWLTVAAREQRDRLVPGDPNDVMTLVFRVKGSDLAAFRADRITREEALKRVEVHEF